MFDRNCYFAKPWVSLLLAGSSSHSYNPQCRGLLSNMKYNHFLSPDLTNPHISVLKPSNRSEMWHAPRHCYRDACQISKWSCNSKRWSRAFQTWQNLIIRPGHKTSYVILKWAPGTLMRGMKCVLWTGRGHSVNGANDNFQHVRGSSMKVKSHENTFPNYCPPVQRTARGPSETLILALTHCGQMTPYGGIDLGQHWLR